MAKPMPRLAPVTRAKRPENCGLGWRFDMSWFSAYSIVIWITTFKFAYAGITAELRSA
jgi:hypothetical protein